LRSLSDILRYSGAVVYEITVPKEQLRSVVEFRDNRNLGVYALAPWQVLATTQSAFEEEPKLTLGEAGESGSGIIKSFRVIKMQVVGDYKDTVMWPRRELIVPEYAQ
jgi:hypothetical protein